LEIDDATGKTLKIQRISEPAPSESKLEAARQNNGHPTKSQWNFGELFPMEQTAESLSVTELTGQIRRVLEKTVGQIWVTGEITQPAPTRIPGTLYSRLRMPPLS